MVTAIDGSILLDILCDHPEFANTSEDALRGASAEGGLIICEVTLAELGGILNGAELKKFTKDLGLQYIPCNEDTATLAGEFFAEYLRERACQSGPYVLSDFIVGTHACLHADRLLTRTRVGMKTYLQRLTVIQPQAA